MGLVTKPYTFSPGTVIQSAQVNSDFDTIYGDYNGGIDGTNVASLSESKVTFSGTGHAHSGGAGGAPVQLVSGSAITSAATITIPTDGNYFVVSGTTAITAINARTAGVFAILRFSGALLLTHNVTTLILLGGESIKTAAGDIVCLISEGGGNWREIWRLRPADSTLSRPQNLRATNNSGAPNTQLDIIADKVAVRSGTSGQSLVITSAATITCDVNTVGPAVNARDQAGAFGAASWVHFYYIYNPTTATLGTIASATAPPTGPTLPSGYTHWAYVGAVRFDGSSHLVVTYIRDGWHSIVNVSVLAATSSAEQTVSLTAVIPPNAQEVRLLAYYNATGQTFNIRTTTGVDFRALGNANVSPSTEVHMPNVGQQVFSKTSTAAASSLEALGYSVAA